jgi:hypothetical protein
MEENSKLITTLVEVFEQEKLKNQLVDNINECIDIPIINEKTEKKLFDGIYGIFLTNIKKMNYIPCPNKPCVFLISCMSCLSGVRIFLNNF